MYLYDAVWSSGTRLRGVTGPRAIDLEYVGSVCI